MAFILDDLSAVYYSATMCSKNPQRKTPFTPLKFPLMYRLIDCHARTATKKGLSKQGKRIPLPFTKAKTPLHTRLVLCVVIASVVVFVVLVIVVNFPKPSTRTSSFGKVGVLKTLNFFFGACRASQYDASLSKGVVNLVEMKEN